MTSGGVRQRRWAIAGVVVLAAVQGWANGVSRLDDLRGAGETVAGWRIALDEASSLIAWYVLMVVIWRLVDRVRPPRFSPFATGALHALATLPVSLCHVGLFLALRTLGYGALGEAYAFTDDWAGSLLYEYRKDAVSYVILALIFAAIQRLTAHRPPPAATLGEPVIEVADGAVRHRVPVAEIAWVEAAGNYVTLHLAGRSLLHRQTLAALESELGQGFARIHRSRLVRRSAVRSVAGQQSGDFVVTLEGGGEVRGSRRYRAHLREP